MEPNLGDVPEDLRAVDEGFCGINLAQVSIGCINAVDVVFETIVSIVDVAILPGGEE